LNIELYDRTFSNKKYTFIPLLYNKFLEDVYKPFKLNIPFHQRPFDILFIGNYGSDRRTHLLKKLNDKYNVKIMSGVNSLDKYINLVEQSKLVLNIYAKESNRIFDYYRFAMLYSNKVLLVNESMKHVDVEIEPNLKELKDVMINIDYDKIYDEIGNYLNKSEKEIEKITSDTYDIFKKNDMNDYLVDFFTPLHKDLDKNFPPPRNLTYPNPNSTVRFKMIFFPS